MYILVKGTMTITGAVADVAARNADERNKKITFKNCAPFTGCISEMNYTQVDNAKDLGVLMPMYNLIEYGDNYAKTSGCICINVKLPNSQLNKLKSETKNTTDVTLTLSSNMNDSTTKMIRMIT